MQIWRQKSKTNKTPKLNVYAQISCIILPQNFGTKWTFPFGRIRSDIDRLKIWKLTAKKCIFLIGHFLSFEGIRSNKLDNVDIYLSVYPQMEMSRLDKMSTLPSSSERIHSDKSQAKTNTDDRIRSD